MKKAEDDYLYFQKKCKADDLLKGKKTMIGIHGIRGSFTDEALSRLAEHLGIQPGKYEVRELVHAKNVVEGVINGSVDRGIFAVANSGSGSYLASVETMARHTFSVIALFTMKINMCILGSKNISSMENITEFRGHPVAIAQCRRTLQKKWPEIPIRPDSDEMDTALSAKMLSDGAISQNAGVFASKRAAKLYGLNILVEGAHDDPLNATSFVVIKK